MTAAALGQGPATGAAPAAAEASLDQIVTHVEQVQAQNHENARPYVATREFDLFKKDQPQPTSKVVAEIQYQPPDTKKYAIRETVGSDRGERVVRHILDSEADMTKNAGESDVTRRNYEFKLLGHDQVNGVPAYVLALKPKRDDKRLIDGRAWVDARNFQILRVEGKLSKNPSWWLKEVNVRIDYGDEGGNWMQKDSTAVAQVRFFGPHTLTSHELKVQTFGEVAVNRPSRPITAAPVRARPHRPSPATAVGAGIPIAE
jgi:hypothetical protein